MGRRPADGPYCQLRCCQSCPTEPSRGGWQRNIQTATSCLQWCKRQWRQQDEAGRVAPNPGLSARVSIGHGDTLVPCLLRRPEVGAGSAWRCWNSRRLKDSGRALARPPHCAMGLSARYGGPAGPAGRSANWPVGKSARLSHKHQVVLDPFCCFGGSCHANA